MSAGCLEAGGRADRAGAPAARPGVQRRAVLVAAATTRRRGAERDEVSARSPTGKRSRSPSCIQGFREERKMNLFETVNAEARAWMRDVMSEGKIADAER